MSSAVIKSVATLDDLYSVEGKAELIAGRIVHYMATGSLPNQIAGDICISLRTHCRTTCIGVSSTDSMGFAVSELSSGRQSFSPDVSFYLGPLPANVMRFIEGPPTFAVEVRSENDYGPAAERDMAAKRADYFEAGTLVVWDVEPMTSSVRFFHSGSADQPLLFQRGQVADAEPAVPGWRLALDEIFA